MAEWHSPTQFFLLGAIASLLIKRFGISLSLDQSLANNAHRCMLCVQWLVHTLGTKASALSRVNHYIGNSPHAVLIQLTISSVLWPEVASMWCSLKLQKIAHCACVYKFNVPFNLDQNHGSGTNLSCSYLQKGIASICLSMACGGSEGLTPCPLCSGCDQRQALHTENSRDATSCRAW